MDFFFQKADAVVAPSKIAYFAIYDPALAVEEDDQPMTVQCLSSRGLMVLLPNDPDTDFQAQLRKVGMVQGMNDFARSYTADDEPLEYVELDNQRIVFGTFEDKYNVVMAIQLAKVDDEGKVEYTSMDVAPIKFLKALLRQGYEDFRLHNGTIGSLSGSMAADEVSRFLQKWWTVWLSNVNLQIEEDGLVKMFDGVRKSRLKVDSEIKTTIDDIQSRHNFKELLVCNFDKDSYENYGTVYEHYKSIELAYKTRLLQWIAETEHYGLTPQTLSQPVVIKTPITESDDTDSQREQVYDPFKLVWSTLGDVSKATGITSGVDAGMKTLSEGVSIMNHGVHVVNSYVPWWGKKPNSSPESVPDGASTLHGDPAHQNRESASGAGVTAPYDSDVHFLIGKVGDTVVFKNVYLNLDSGEKLHRLVLFKYHDFVIALVYEFSVNTLNDASYYDELFPALDRLAKQHFPQQIDSEKNFYYVGFHKSTKVIESNLPLVPLNISDGDSNDSKYFYDLSMNRAHSLMIHREVLTSIDTANRDSEMEKLFRTRNGWWVYNYKTETNEVIIIKKWKLFKNGTDYRQSLLESSANIIATIGVDAKEWLDDYLDRHK